MKAILTILAVTLFSSTFAQVSTPDLYGHWEFAGVHDETLEEEAQQMLQSFFGTLTLDFKESGGYDLRVMTSHDTGSWMLAESQINLESRKEGEKTIEIISLDGDDMAIRMQGMEFRVARSVE